MKCEFCGSKMVGGLFEKECRNESCRYDKKIDQIEYKKIFEEDNNILFNKQKEPIGNIVSTSNSSSSSCSSSICSSSSSSCSSSICSCISSSSRKL